MAAVVVEWAMNLEGKPSHFHPFFSQKKKHEITPMISAQNGHDGQLGATDNDGEEEEDTKKRSKKQVANGQPTIFQGFRIKPEVTARSLEEAAAFTGPIPQVDLEVDPNYERRKRRKTVSPKTEQSTRNESHAHRAVTSDCDEGYVALEWHEQLKAEASKGTEEVEEQVPELDEPGSGQANGTNKQPIQYAERAASNSDQTTPTKSKDDELKTTRTMRLKGGKLASPIAQEQESLKTPRKSRRPKVVDPATLVVKVDYGRLSADAQKLGERIQGILNGNEVHRLPIFPKTKAAKANAKPEGPPKPTHPFFSGKVMKQEVNAKGNKAEETISARAQSPSVELTRPSPRKASTTTPGKLRAQRDAFLMPGSLSPKRGTAALSARKKLKSAGEHPSWPTRETAHVRALESLESSSPVDLRAFGYTLKSAKRKVDSNTVDQAESVLQVLASNINASEAVPRRPQRTVTTGPEIQSFVAKGLSTGIEDGQDTSSNNSVHPALKAMYRGIEGSLSAFDRFECETQTWALKYAPKSAAEVLQAGKEAFVLRDFLQRSIVSAVQTSSKRSTASSTISSNRGVQKKRKRKDEDDFIVESDAELDEQDELLPLSDSSRERRYQWSLARGGDEYLRSTPGSTVLLSGPSGCGKTAAVYAVARELGFEVFEINSASRRSGKDVLDKIGDMAENHLVQQVSKALTEDRPTTNDTRLEAIKIEQQDVPDPKQKSMGSFFKAAPAAKKSAPSSKQLLQKSVAQAKGNNTKPKSQQKQSLILLEEVDVLFEEDKQFWMTILTLAAHSKRPIIMTCNDEKYVPIEALTFHAILRFVPPPTDLAIDYLLLLAAREGHLLERQSVESLYRIKGHDVRGSITELDLWCQIAVGDPTRGFNWMLDRYPPGTDVDAHGRTLRVTSERTYVKGMNVVCHDLQQSERESITLQQSLWSQAWEDWQVNAMDGFENLGEFDSSIGLLKPEQNGSNALDRFVFMADVLSAGDVCFGFCMREPKQQRLDHTTPPLREKIIASHAFGPSGHHDLLGAEPIVDYTALDKQLAIESHLMAAQLSSREPYDGNTSQSAAKNIVCAVEAKNTSITPPHLSRNDFSIAFDSLAYDPDDSSSGTGVFVVPSSFDREFRVITTDLGPYIRTIAREHQRREEERMSMSNLLSAGGKRRQTRVANAALDGGRRSERTARYFELLRKMHFNVSDALATGGESWSATSSGTAAGSNSVIEDEIWNLRSTQGSDEIE